MEGVLYEVDEEEQEKRKKKDYEYRNEDELSNADVLNKDRDVNYD